MFGTLFLDSGSSKDTGSKSHTLVVIRLGQTPIIKVKGIDLKIHPYYLMNMLNQKRVELAIKANDLFFNDQN